jgi:hypothetical protein
VDGTYELVHDGSGIVAYCQDESGAGCICAFGTNCVSQDSVEFTQLEGDPLTAGTAYQVWVDTTEAPVDFTISVQGP